MKRFLFAFGLFLVLTSLSILFFQWMGFATESAGEYRTAEVDQSFSIIHMEGRLRITQTIHFSSMSSDPIRIQWPEGAEEYTCKNKEGENCLTKENGEFLLINLNNDLQEITITYSLKQPAKADFVLLKDWYPVLSTVSTMNTEIQVTEKILRSGKWISGYRNSDYKKLEYIDYYFFSGQGGPSDLVWTKDSWKEKESGAVRVLIDEESPVGFEKDVGSFETSGGFVTVILTKKIKPYHSPNLIVTDGDSVDLPNAIRRSLLYQTLSSEDDGEWLKELIVSLLLKETPDSPKSAWAYKQLKEGLRPSQWADLRQRMEEVKDQRVDRLMLDDAVSSVTGFNSTFFAENKKMEENIPLILNANKPIMIKQKSLQLPYISYKQKEFIQFPQAVEALGIKVKELQPGVYFTTINGNTLRFYVNENYFIYNEENYGLLVKPVQTVGNSIYIDVHWFEKLFKVEVNKKENAIEIFKEM